MDLEKRSAGFGAAILIFAVLLRLLQGTLVLPTYAFRPESEGSSLLRPPGIGVSAVESTVPSQIKPTVPVPPTTQPPLPQLPEPLRFQLADVAHLTLRTASDCGYYPDLTPLLLQPLNWDLRQAEPAVLIIHSHACEGYTRVDGESYTELPNCRTTDTEYNMVAVGDALARLLQAQGIGVIHDRQLHDGTSYTAAYSNARASAKQILQQYPSIRLVLDLHRDAATLANGDRYATAATVDGQPAAQFMFVVGTDYRNGNHALWQENLALALKLQVLLEQRAPGITRPTSLRGSHFNQDLSVGALLIEVGASGNTRAEVANALPVLADAIAALAQGAVGE